MLSFFSSDSSSKKEKTSWKKRNKKESSKQMMMKLMEQNITQRIVEYETRNNQMISLLNEQVSFLKSELSMKTTLIENLMRELELRSNAELAGQSVSSNRSSYISTGGSASQTSSGYSSISSANNSRSSVRYSTVVIPAVHPVVAVDPDTSSRESDEKKKLSQGRRKKRRKKKQSIRESNHVLCTYV